ncbi:MAG: putative toxin-antitoxin system toxin component, PIN family [Ginsengibacter sp.]
MKRNNFFVFDTNSLISATLILSSVNAKALDAVLDVGRLVISEPVLQEFKEVIFRKKFDRYFLTLAERLEAIDKIEHNSLWFSPIEIISECCDPKDNKFLELAVACDASCIISGDDDLLVLNPFRTIPILNASNFLTTFFI